MAIDNMSVKERLVEFIKFKNLSQSKFEKSIYASNGYVNNIRKSLGLDKIEQIRAVYPELNIDWLLTGHGEMLKSTSGNNCRNVHNTGKIGGGVMTGDNNAPINTSITSDSEQRILLLEERVQHLEEMLKEKERFIQVLLKNK